jgi:hypothetical protein
VWAVSSIRGRVIVSVVRRVDSLMVRCLFTRSRSDNLSSSQILREDRATTTCYTCCLGVCTSLLLWCVVGPGAHGENLVTGRSPESPRESCQVVCSGRSTSRHARCTPRLGSAVGRRYALLARVGSGGLVL